MMTKADTSKSWDQNHENKSSLRNSSCQNLLLLPALSLRESVERVPGEFLWLQFEKLSVDPLHPAKTTKTKISKVIKSKAALVDKPLESKESLTPSAVAFSLASLSSSCSDVTRASFSVTLATQQKTDKTDKNTSPHNMWVIFSC